MGFGPTNDYGIYRISTTTPTLISGFHNIVAFILLFAYLVCITEHLYHHLWLLAIAEEQRLEDSRVDRFVFSYQHVVNITKFGTHQFEVLVQFKISARATTGQMLFGIPVFRVNGATDFELCSLSGHRYAGKDWIFRPSGLWLPHIEAKSEIRIGCHTFVV